MSSFDLKINTTGTVSHKSSQIDAKFRGNLIIQTLKDFYGTKIVGVICSVEILKKGNIFVQNYIEGQKIHLYTKEGAI